jgi:tetratricopeptide (TPR) repeat protein
VRAAIGRAEAPGGDETFWAVRRFLEGLARERPLVVCLEDLHWAAPRFLDLVEYLAGWTRDVPLLLLCLARGDLLDRRPEWVAPRAGAEALALEPLAGTEADALVRAASGEAALTEATRAWIAATAEGNPLFVEQLAAAVLEAGAGEPPAIPATIQALLAARLDRLEPAERAAIERAAVIGKQFTARAVADLSPPEEREAVGRRLAALLRKELVRPERGGPGGEDAFAFRHALIRDAAYDAMPKALRADLHARVARWLEEHAGERLPELEEILGHHLEQAHRLRVELGYRDAGTEALRTAAGGRLAAAGGRAFRREDMPAAAALLRRAAALLPARDAERLEALRRLGQACWDVGDAEGAEAAHEGLLAAARAAGDRRLEAWALLERTVQRQFTTDAETVLEAARRAIAVFREAGDELGLARAWRRVAAAERRRGRYGEAERAGREALRHALAAGDGLEESHVVDGLCACLLYGPTPAEEGLRLCREMLARARRPSQTANVLSAVAGLEALRGRFPEAREAYGRAAAIFEELGLRVPLAGLTQVGVPLELLAGDPAAAEREARRGLAVLEGLGQAAVQAPLLATALLAAGRDAEAAEALAAVDPEAAPQLVPWWVIWHAAHARLELRAGRSGEALAHAEDAVRLAEGTDDPSLAGDAWLALAEARRARGDDAGAEAAATAARERFARKGNVAGSRLAASPA